MYLNLKVELLKNNMTIRELSEAIGISERSLSKKINGKTDFHWREILKIREILNPEADLDVLFIFKELIEDPQKTA